MTERTLSERGYTKRWYSGTCQHCGESLDLWTSVSCDKTYAVNKGTMVAHWTTCDGSIDRKALRRDYDRLGIYQPAEAGA